MRKLLLVTILFSGTVSAQGGDPGAEAGVAVLEVPSAGAADRIEVRGLPAGAEITGLPQGWRVAGRRGGVTYLEGPAANQPNTIRFTTSTPPRQASVVGYQGRKPVWNVGPRTLGPAEVAAMTAGEATGAAGSRSGQHHETDLDLLGERAGAASGTNLAVDRCGDFSCPDGTGPACLEAGDKVCPASSKCVDAAATCFDDYPCGAGGGFVCASGYDGVLNDYRNAVRLNDELAAENLALRERRLEQKNCVINAATLKAAIACVR